MCQSHLFLSFHYIESQYYCFWKESDDKESCLPTTDENDKSKRPTIIILKKIHQHQGPEAAVIPMGLCSDSEHGLQLMFIPLDHTHSQQTVAL